MCSSMLRGEGEVKAEKREKREGRERREGRQEGEVMEEKSEEVRVERLGANIYIEIVFH